MMKRRFIFFIIIIVMVGLLVFPEAQLINLKVVSTGVHDIASDINNVVHLVWSQRGVLYYGQIESGKIINSEIIPKSYDYKTSFIRPRLSVRPDGRSVHLSWMNARPGTELIHVWKNSNGWHREIVWEKSDDYHVSAPFAVCDLKGTVHVMAQLWRSDGSELYNKIVYWYKRAYSTSWNKGFTIWEGTKKWRDISMFVDIHGGVHAVFKSGSDPGKYIYAPNGKLLKDQKIEDIPIAPGKRANCVSFGDLYVTKNGQVHHAFMTYKRETIDYARKNSLYSSFSSYSQPSLGGIHICEEENYPNPWPSIAVASWGEVMVTWAEMPCPHKTANRIVLSIKSKNSESWKKKIITNTALIHKDSKPSITANDDGIFLVYRNNNRNLMLYTTAEIIHVNQPPVARLTYSPDNGLYPLRVTLDASGSYDPDGSIVRYLIDFGDGTSSNVKRVDNVYSKPGTYTVELKVTDNDGASSYAKGVINVFNIKPPINQKYELNSNETLFFNEYYYKITWEHNPVNDQLNAIIISYKIYRSDKGKNNFSLLDIVSSRYFTYYDRSLGREKKEYDYKIRALDSEGRLSD